jgi:hypothetical protein
MFEHPEKITDSNTSDIYIWKLVMPAARAASATFGASFVKSRRTPLPIVWKCTGNPLAATASHIGFHHGSHSCVMSPRREISRPRTPPRRATRSISPTAASNCSSIIGKAHESPLWRRDVRIYADNHGL